MTDITFDVHLMIERPERYIDAFADAGADIVCFHQEACADIPEAIRKIKARGKRPAISIKPATPLTAVYDYLPDVEMILIMSVEPGFGGQGLIPETLRKAEELAAYITKRGLAVDIEMDGGIYLSNVRQVIDSGVNVVVAGSAVFGSEDPAKAVAEFYGIFGQKQARS